MKFRLAHVLFALVLAGECMHAQSHKPIRIITAAHAGDVLGIFISESDSLVASCGLDGTVKLWRLPEMTLLCAGSGHSSMVNNVSFSGDDRHIASASNDRTIRIWSANGCTQEQLLSGHQGDVLCVYFSQTDTGRFVVSGSTDRTVKMWDWQTGAELKTFRGHTGAVTGVAFSYNDSLIASCGDDMQVLVWSPTSPSPAITLSGPPHTAPCTTVLFPSTVARSPVLIGRASSRFGAYRKDNSSARSMRTTATSRT